MIRILQGKILDFASLSVSDLSGSGISVMIASADKVEEIPQLLALAKKIANCKVALEDCGKVNVTVFFKPKWSEAKKEDVHPDPERLFDFSHESQVRN